MTIKLNDQTTFEVTKMLYNEFRDEENEKHLDEDHLQEFKKNFIKPLYPHKTQTVNGDKVTRKYNCGQFCCDLSPGNFFCCDTSPPDDDYKKFGLGACLYFKFLRHLMLFFLLLSVLCLFSVLLYYFVSINNGFNIAESYQNFVFAGTIGSLSAERTGCQYSEVVANSTQFTVSCSTGTVQTYARPVTTDQTLNSLLNCRHQIDKIQENLTQFFLTGTTENRSCSSDGSSCNIILSDISTTSSYVSYPYSCIDSEYTLGSVTFTQQIIIYVTVSIDLAIILFFLFFLGSENEAEKKQEKYFKSKELALHDFAIKVQGFNSASFDFQFDFLAKGLDQQIQHMTSFTENIVQVKVLDTIQMREAIKQRRKAYKKLFNLIEYCFFDEMVDPNKYKSAQDFVKKCYGSVEEPAYIQYKKQLNDGMIEYMESKELKIDNEKGSQVSCYLVMSNPKFKRSIFQNAYQKCFTKYLKVQERQYPISEPPVADMILWENKHKWTILRVIIVWIITLAIIFCSYLLVGVAQAEKDKIGESNNFQIDCDLVFTVNQRQAWDSSLASTAGYTHCYCYYNYFQLYNFSDTTNCQVWHSDYLLYLGIPILISLGIVVYNLIISRFFKIMSKCEGHDELTSQLYSYIIKRTFVLVMNMGLLMILLKLQYPGTFGNGNVDFLFQGTYNDVTADWYLEIGVIITLTLCINIFIPILEMLMLGFLRWLRRVWDKRCCMRKTSQKTKKGYLQLYAGDVYPIEERYADLLSIVIITLAFSAVIPALYIIACISLIFMGICDKFLLFRVYQHPVNYTAKLQSKVFKTIYFTLIVHCVASAFLLSQPNLIVGIDNSFFLNLGTDSSRFNTIFSTSYIIPYVVLFCVLFVWGFLNATIISLIKHCNQKCKKHEMSQIRRDKLNTNFYDALDQYQTHRLKLSLEREVNKKFQTTLKKDNYMKANDTESYFFKGTQKIHEREIICRQTLITLQKREKQKNQRVRQTKLIGKAGYQEIFDDQVFNRERKIRILDQNLKDIFKKSLQEKSSAIQLSDININV